MTTILDYFMRRQGAAQSGVPSGDTNSGVDQSWNRASQLLKNREAQQNMVYNDSQGNLTVGIGHKVQHADLLNYGDLIPDEQAEQSFQGDLYKAMGAAQGNAKAAGISDPDFLGNLAAVNFQLGSGWTSKFPDAWQKIKNGDYNGAADAVALSRDGTGASDWYKQTPLRVKDFQDALHALSASQGADNGYSSTP